MATASNNLEGKYASWHAQFDSLLYGYELVGYVGSSFLALSHHPGHTSITTCYGIKRDLLFNVLLYCNRKYSKNIQGIKEANLLAECVNWEGVDRKNEDVLSFLSFHAPARLGFCQELQA